MPRLGTLEPNYKQNFSFSYAVGLRLQCMGQLLILLPGVSTKFILTWFTNPLENHPPPWSNGGLFQSMECADVFQDRWSAGCQISLVWGRLGGQASTSPLSSPLEQNEQSTHAAQAQSHRTGKTFYTVRIKSIFIFWTNSKSTLKHLLTDLCSYSQCGVVHIETSQQKHWNPSSFPHFNMVAGQGKLPAFYCKQTACVNYKQTVTWLQESPVMVFRDELP